MKARLLAMHIALMLAACTPSKPDDGWKDDGWRNDGEDGSILAHPTHEADK